MRMKTLALCAALSLAGGSAQAEVKVGFITTLSGGGASLGTDVRDGFMLAIQQSGRDDIKVLIEDDQRKPDLAVSLADKLIQSEKVDVLSGILWSNLALAVVPNALAQNTFYLSPNAGPSQLAGERCHPDYFNVSWQNDTLHESAGAYARDAGFKTTAIITPNYPAGKDAASGFKRLFQGAPAAEIYTKLGQTDYASEIAQLRSSGADSIFVFLPGGMGISFLKQYQGSGISLPVLGTGASFDQRILQAVQDAALGAINTSQWSKDLPNEANKAFVSSFSKEYDRLPSLFASQGFDTANLLISAIKVADINDRDAFREALRSANFASVRGNFAFANNQHPIQDFHVRQVVKEGDVYTNKVIGLALKDHKDSYAKNCKM